MTSKEQEILDCLVELDSAAKSMKSANPKPDLMQLFSRLDELASQLPRETDAGLIHYLHKRSYEKARLFLQGRDAENKTGSCGHV